jgi:large subunit ribosomal protein L10
MDNPRAEKVAVVDEVRERFGDATASVVTEYRGLTVAELAELRQTLAPVGGDYKIFKNTLVRRAVADTAASDIESLLVGPTGIAFIHGDVSAVAKALRDFSRANPHLVIKGGVVDGAVVSSGELAALADLPPRDVLLARLAGALAAPLRQLGGLLEALPRNMAYGLSALLEQRGGAPVDEQPAVPEAEADAPAPAAETDSAPEVVEADAPADEIDGAPEAGSAPEVAAAEAAEAGTTPEASAPDVEEGSAAVEADGTSDTQTS